MSEKLDTTLTSETEQLILGPCLAVEGLIPSGSRVSSRTLP